MVSWIFIHKKVLLGFHFPGNTNVMKVGMYLEGVCSGILGVIFQKILKLRLKLNRKMNLKQQLELTKANTTNKKQSISEV